MQHKWSAWCATKFGEGHKLGLLEDVSIPTRNVMIPDHYKKKLLVCLDNSACRAHLKEFLDHIVSKDVYHQLISRLEYFIEHKLALGWSGTFQLELDKSIYVAMERKCVKWDTNAKKAVKG